jgi:cytidylate kinase
MEGARKLVERHDQWRNDYLRNYHDADWEDPLLYHLTLNTGKVDPDDATELIVDYVRRISDV